MENEMINKVLNNEEVNKVFISSMVTKYKLKLLIEGKYPNKRIIAQKAAYTRTMNKLYYLISDYIPNNRDRTYMRYTIYNALEEKNKVIIEEKKKKIII